MTEAAKFNFAYAILQFCQNYLTNFCENLLHVLQYSLLTVIQKFLDVTNGKNALYYVIDLIYC